MPTKIFVGRIAEGTSSDELRSLFRKYGKVVECDVITNFGFVHMDTEEEANAAIAALDGHNINGSRISVEISTAGTQGRQKKIKDGFGPSQRGGRGGGGPGRPDPYPVRRDSYGNGGRPYEPAPPAAPVRSAPASQQREEYASEQVKELLELYIRDPVAFDQYARSYYYGERSERRPVPTQYYDRPPVQTFVAPAPATYRR